MDLVVSLVILAVVVIIAVRLGLFRPTTEATLSGREPWHWRRPDHDGWP